MRTLTVRALAALVVLVAAGTPILAQLPQSCASSLSFDGVDDVVTIGASTPADVFDFSSGGAPFSSPTAFTLELWFKTTYSGAPQPLLSKWGDGGGVLPEGWRLLIDENFVYLRFESTVAINLPLQPNQLALGLNDGKWHHLAITHFPSSCSYDVYFDGQNVTVNPGLNPFCSSGGGAASASPNPLLIGGQFPSSVLGTPALSFDGSIDEVRIWNVARTPTQLASTRFTTLTGTEPGLIGYWNLDEGGTSLSTQTVADMSPSMADGTRGTTASTEAADPAWSVNGPLADLGGGQANAMSSRLEINGAGTGTAAGPFLVTSAPGGALTFSFSGDPNRPFLLLTGPVNAGRIVSPLVGSLDLGDPLSCTPSPFSDIGVVLSGFDGFGALFFNTGAAGTATLSASLPPFVTGSIGLQGLMATASGFGLHFTAAFHIAIL